MAKATNTDRWR